MDTAQIERVIAESPIPVVLAFLADWCGPCKRTKPILERAEQSLRGGVRFITINLEEHPGIADQFAVLRLPTILVYQHGKLEQRMVGAQSPHALTKALYEIAGRPRLSIDQK